MVEFEAEEGARFYTTLELALLTKIRPEIKKWVGPLMLLLNTPTLGAICVESTERFASEFGNKIRGADEYSFLLGMLMGSAIMLEARQGPLRGKLLSEVKILLSRK